MKHVAVILEIYGTPLRTKCYLFFFFFFFIKKNKQITTKKCEKCRECK